MPGDNGYYAPTQYAVIWPIIGLVLVALIIAWYIWMFRYLKHRTQGAKPPAPVPPPTPEALRDRYLRLIDEIERDFAAGELTMRRAHQKLGLIVRMYAEESIGVRAQVMTLDDLNRARLFPVANAVSKYYPAEFREVESGSVEDAAVVARQVVNAWN